MNWQLTCFIVEVCCFVLMSVSVWQNVQVVCVFLVGGTGLCFVFNLRMLIHLLFAKEDVRRCSREFGSRESEPPTPRFLNRLRVLSSFYFTFHVTVVSASTSAVAGVVFST